jgi:hypothetical protein
VVLPSMVSPESMERLTTAYAEAVTSATGDDIRVGSTSTKVSDFVNRGAAFDNLYVFPSLLEACWQVIGGPFKLSSFHARTLRQGAYAQELHVDVPRNSDDWPLLGFILMVDDFRPTTARPDSSQARTGGRALQRTRCRMYGPHTNPRCWHAELLAGCLSSTGPPSTATPQIHRTGRAGPSRAHSFLWEGVLRPTSRPACNPRRARDSVHSRTLCSPFRRSNSRLGVSFRGPCLLSPTNADQLAERA